MCEAIECKIGEHVGISPLTKKQVKPTNSFIDDHLLFCNQSSSYDNFSIQTSEKKVFIWIERKPVLMRDQPSLNRNITSANTPRKVSKYGVFSDPYLSIFSQTAGK